MFLQPIESIGHIQPPAFLQQYFYPRQPVVLHHFLADKTVLTKWTYDYLIHQAGDIQVPLYGRESSFNDWVTSPPVKQVPLKEYLSLIQHEPTDLRLFLFNLLQKKPSLKKDLQLNDVTGGKVLRWLPYLFFGGEGSSVRYHYDIDMSHVFLTQLQGIKRVLLFAPDQSTALYRLPFNFHGIVNLSQPDYEQFPALKRLTGWECCLHPGDTLYIPSGFWHYIQYVSAGYSVSYRALSPSVLDRLTGFRNIFITRRFDNTMRRLFKERWYQYKLNQAIKRATAVL